MRIPGLSHNKSAASPSQALPGIQNLGMQDSGMCSGNLQWLREHCHARLWIQDVPVPFPAASGEFQALPRSAVDPGHPWHPSHSIQGIPSLSTLTKAPQLFTPVPNPRPWCTQTHPTAPLGTSGAGAGAAVPPCCPSFQRVGHPPFLSQALPAPPCSSPGPG